MTRVGAVILAAGAGTRLGTVAKALLVRDGRSYLATILATARELGLHDAVVVVGPPHGDAVAAHARELGARIAHNPRPERGMASSVALGFAAITPPHRPAAVPEADAAWLWPVDHPFVAPATLRALVAALADHAAVRPTFGGRGGHPPLIARALWPRLAGCADLDGGARAVLAAAAIADVAVDDPGCVRDVDTPADLEARP
ncbi:MAG TPA: nucleotidyltransferase family protein [Kofleriaceae bacterium]|nr:nucleotidyltransferase family protein [Kofleriaceae bacterium]